MKLKSQYKAAKEEARSKEYELEDIKRNIKFTRIHEHEIEVETFQKHYESLLLQNKKQAKIIEDLQNYKELYFKLKKTNETNENKILDLTLQLAYKDEELCRALSSTATTKKINQTTNSEFSQQLKSSERVNGNIASLKLTTGSSGSALKREKFAKKSVKKQLGATSISTGKDKNNFTPSFHDYIDKINYLNTVIE